MKRIIAIGSATALLVVGTAFVVHAASAGVPACADITNGTGTYTPPRAAGTLPGDPPAAPGVLTWDMTLAAKSCPDVQYAVTVYLNGVLEGVGTPVVTAPAVIGSAITTGDTISQILQFQLEINQSEAAEVGRSVCVVASTSGVASSAAPSSKKGSAFDADGSGSAVWDRDPDGPPGGDTAGPGETDYCVPVGTNESPGRTAG